MFTQISPSGIRDAVLGSTLVDLLTGPHGIDRYTELVEPTWTLGEARAKVVAVRRDTPRSVMLTLKPNAVFTAAPALKAGQHVNLTVEIDGRRHTRCYSPANAEGARHVELTIGVHDRGLVSRHLFARARVGTVVGLSGGGGEFTLSAVRPRRILLIAGGSGITPVLAMLRTLAAERAAGSFDGEVVLIQYARTAALAGYRRELDELAAVPGVRVLRCYTRGDGRGDLVGRFAAAHLGAALPDPDAVYACGPDVLVDAVRAQCPQARSESFVPPVFEVPAQASGGRVSFADSGVDVVDDGRSLLEQAENAGLTPESGCRMGICHTCTRRKTAGAVRNLLTGTVSTTEAEDVQICVTAPVGDVEISL